MIQNVVTRIDGIGVYGAVSIAIFFTFFTGMLLWAFLQKRSYLEHMRALPLENEKTPTLDVQSHE